MSIHVFTEGTSVVFLSSIGYRNKKGQVKYDVRTGDKGIIKQTKIVESVPLYDVQLLHKRTLDNKDIIEGVSGERLSSILQDIIKPVEEFPRKPKKKRPWRKFTDEQLEAFATANGIDWKRNENKKVNRMFLVKALDDSGIEAPDEIDAKNLTKKIS